MGFFLDETTADRCEITVEMMANALGRRLRQGDMAV
jgi:hypothetical protein